MDLKLQGKKALVTGSSSGIGEAIAKCLAQEGAHVMVQGRRKKELERVVGEIKAAGGVAYYVEGDLSSDEDAKRIQEKTLGALQKLDILINNAGIFRQETWLHTTPKEWLEMLNINVIGPLRMIQAFLPQMKELGWGRIIQIASAAALSPSPGQPGYGASKAALLNMSLSLAKELGGTGVTVNTVSPGPIVTDRVKEMFEGMAAQRNWTGDWSEIEKRVTQEILPNMEHRFGTPEEVASWSLFYPARRLISSQAPTLGSMAGASLLFKK